MIKVLMASKKISKSQKSKAAHKLRSKENMRKIKTKKEKELEKEVAELQGRVNDSTQAAI
jgi:hypothetical protein